MRARAYFWHFWRITPDEYRALSVAEHNAMSEVMQDYAREQKKAAQRARARR